MKVSVLYVDNDHGSDFTGDGSFNDPFLTLERAKRWSPKNVLIKDISGKILYSKSEQLNFAEILD